jgi:hypothetical protein
MGLEAKGEAQESPRWHEDWRSGNHQGLSTGGFHEEVFIEAVLSLQENSESVKTRRAEPPLTLPLFVDNRMWSYLLYLLLNPKKPIKRGEGVLPTF